MNATTIQNFAVLALVVGALAYAIYKHFGTAKVKAELEQLKADPAAAIRAAIDSAKASAPAQADPAAAQPAPAAQPSPTAEAPAAAAPAAAAPLSVTASTDAAAKIRALIIQWRSAGADWPQIGLYLQTGFGLGRPLTADEWNAAISSGFPRELAVVDHGGEGGPAFQLRPEMTFAEAAGQAIAFQGSTEFKVTDCPARVAVWIFQHSGSFTDPYDVIVNGVAKHVINPIVYDPILVDGPVVNVQVVDPKGYWLNANIKAA